MDAFSYANKVDAASWSYAASPGLLDLRAKPANGELLDGVLSLELIQCGAGGAQRVERRF